MIESNRLVRDLMISLDEYAIVSENATLLDALNALDAAQSSVKDGNYLHRAVLVCNYRGRIIGKIGHLAFLRALRTRHDRTELDPHLRRAGLDEEMLLQSESVYRLFNDDVTSLCGKSRTIRVCTAMNPINERIHENDSLLDALDVFVRVQTQSLLAIRDGRAVGILRLVDLFDEIAETMKNCTEGT